MCKIQKLFKYSNMNVRRNISTACLEKRVSIQGKYAMKSVKMSNTQRNDIFDLISKCNIKQIQQNVLRDLQS